MGKAVKLIRAIAFLLVFGLVFVHVQELVTPDYNWPEDSDRFGDNVRGVYKEPRDALQVLWIGTSHMRCGVTPMVVYRESGIRSYNLATNGQSIGLSYARLKTALRRFSPKVVVFEASACFHSEETNQKTGMWQKLTDTLSWYRLSDKYLISKDLVELTGADSLELTGGLFPLVRYHTRYLLEESDYGADNRERLSFTKGYCFRSNQKGAKPVTETAEEMPEEAMQALVEALGYNRPYVEKMVALCREHGCELVLTKIPVNGSLKKYHSNWGIEKHQLIADMAQELGCRFVDLNYEDIDLDWSKDTTDQGRHLNTSGARKASRFLGKWLSENFDFGAAPGQALKDSWDRQLELYTYEEAIYDLQMEDDAQRYFDRVAGDGHTLLITASQAALDALSDGMRERLTALTGAADGLPDGAVCLAVVRDGQLIDAQADAATCSASGVLGGDTDYALERRGDKSVIKAGTLTYKSESGGLHIVAYDEALGSVVDCITLTQKKGALRLKHEMSTGKKRLRRALAVYENAVMRGL